MRYAIGIDIGGTNFRIGLVGEDGSLLHFEKKSSAMLQSGDRTAALGGAAARALGEEISQYLTSYARGVNVCAAAIGVPSSVSKDKRTIYSTPNLSGLDNIDLRTPLEKELGMPVFIERDVNYLLQNDILRLGLNAGGTILGFYVGTGFGNAIYLEGKFYAGRTGAAGELGHIPMLGASETCNCGNVGCVETVCCGKSLEALTAKHFPGTSIREVFARHVDDERIKRFVADLSIPIATEINILDPDESIIAGGVVGMQGFPKDLLESEVRARVRKPYPYKDLKLIFTEHTQQSGVLGGGRYALACC